MEATHWQATLDQNFLAAVELIQTVLLGMVSRRFGRIVNITSVSLRSSVLNLELGAVAETLIASVPAG
ncbi:SDR family NAD(P)-dependent oxidoreductase [Alcaligenes sp. PF14]|uniref:SDR family NAD(P)-dependent oxidoreductase n=1 Tax=Alcaligenes sp. PF14 TaxID=3120297 RepID=UPI003FA56D41